MYPVGGMLYTRGTLPMPVTSYRTQNKITAPDLSMKSGPRRPAASVGSEHTRNAKGEFASVQHQGNRLLSLTVEDIFSHSIRFRCGDLIHLSIRRAAVSIRWSGCLNQTSRHSPYLHLNIGCAVLQQNGNRGFYGSVVTGVEVDGAVFIRTSLPFPFILRFLSNSPFRCVWGLSLGERRERSLGFLLPGESEGLTSLLSLLEHYLTKCSTPSHS
jgi:hypothetical protein